MKKLFHKILVPVNFNRNTAMLLEKAIQIANEFSCDPVSYTHLDVYKRQDMARRNGCRKKADAKFLTEATNRDMMTMVAIFQYMIGNTDWAVLNNHNTKLIYDRNNEKAPPYVVPYDFDYCGLVNAEYAIPNELIGTEKVTERVYRGFPRTMEEIQITLDIFRAKKDSIIALINNFQLLSNRTKKEMLYYLEYFFRIINNKNEVKSIFIDNARTS